MYTHTYIHRMIGNACAVFRWHCTCGLGIVHRCMRLPSFVSCYLASHVMLLPRHHDCICMCMATRLCIHVSVHTCVYTCAAYDSAPLLPDPFPKPGVSYRLSRLMAPWSPHPSTSIPACVQVYMWGYSKYKGISVSGTCVVCVDV